MKIKIISSENGNNAGGLALTCTQLQDILSAIGHDVSLELTIGNSDYFVLDGGYDKNLGNKIRKAVFVDEISSQLKKEKIDLLISYGAGDTAYITFLLSRKIDCPYYVVLCGSDINISFGNNELFSKNQIAIQNAKKIIGLSNELIENSRVFDAADKYYLIPNAYSINNKLSLKEIDISKNLTFGTGSTFLSEKKGIALLLRTFSNFLKKYHRNDKLFLYGKIDSDIKIQYEDLISKYGLANNIELCGYLSREEFNKRFDSIDIYLQFSPYEGCCNSLGEAIFSGKFVFLSDTGYFAEKIKEISPRSVFNQFNEQCIADNLFNYIQKIGIKDDRLEIIDFLKKELSFESVCGKWKDVMESETMIVSGDKNFQTPIVMFHDINNSFTGIDYEKKAFEKLVELVDSKGFRLVSYDEYKKSEDKSNLIICTFDDGYENVYLNAFPIMKKFNFTATVFICPDLLGLDNSWNHRDGIIRYQMNSKQVCFLVENGWEIGSHGLNHINMERLSQTELENNLYESKRQIEELINKKCRSFCYPYGLFKPYIKTVVKKIYEVAFSVDCGGIDFEKDTFQITRIVPEELKSFLLNLR